MSYNLQWKKYTGEKVTNIADYVEKWLNTHPHAEVIVGCDSQLKPKEIKYSISICMHKRDAHGIGHGAHVVFANHYVTEKAYRYDIRRKLWLETELAVEAGGQIKDVLTKMNKKALMHLDYNSNPRYAESNSLLKNGIGYAEGMGFKAVGKPDAWVASHASDALCKNKQAKGVR
jgi:predicted RNase H-related nuclease YkuK (DUF458 family)